MKKHCKPELNQVKEGPGSFIHSELTYTDTHTKTVCTLCPKWLSFSYLLDTTETTFFFI